MCACSIRIRFASFLRRVFLLSSVVIAALGVTVHCRAERVGFSFQGALTGPSTGTYSLFGFSVPRNSVISGTFSYDTTASAVDVASGWREFAQQIEGGLTFDINHGQVKLAATDYRITVVNNYQRAAPPETVDIFSVDFDNRFSPTPEPIRVNGVPWSGPGAAIKLELSWPPETFEGPDEPKLTADRPLTAGYSISAFGGAFVASSATSANPTPRLFSVSSIDAIDAPAGDLNRNGSVEADDLVEWQNSFGATSIDTDPNGDGQIDAADYVMIRKLLVSGVDGENNVQPIPEPTSLLMFGVLIGFALLRGEQVRYRRVT
jgi:hypothetical protein